MKTSDFNTAENRLASMTGKQVIITGPTSGIGKEIALQLAALGAELVLGCRDVERGQQTAAEITRRAGANSIAVMGIDTSSQRSIRNFARQYRDTHTRLDVLVNNAGLNRARRQTSIDGVELTFATNVLGYYLLTRELLEILEASAPARIVNVASGYAGNLDLDDLQFERRVYDRRKAYAQSKACDRLLTWAFARRLEHSGVTANAMAPGLVQTRLYRDTPVVTRLILRLVGLRWGRSASQGADTAVWSASSPDVEGVSGKFFEERQAIECEFRNTETEEKLWGICDRLSGIV
jgi:NAD(P)-dependent dehydrogenase (short-subunit alcohol dehydrogenase family)